MMVVYRTRNPLLSSTWIARPSLTSVERERNDLNGGDRDLENVRGRIEDAYHDDPPPEFEGPAATSQAEESGTNVSDGRGMLVQPSRLQNEESRWRED